MEKARSQAIIDFRIDATAKLVEYNRLLRKPFTGRIGKVKRSAALTSLNSGYYYGIVLRMDDVVSGEVIITDIGTLFDTTGNVTVLIYNNLNTLVDSQVVNTTANALTNNTVSITLPMHSDYVENLEYYIVVQYSGGAAPYNNEFYDECNSLCNAKKTTGNKQFGFTDYMSVSGVGLSSVADLSDVTTTSSNRCYGLTLGVKARCKVDDVWCYDEIDYTGDPTSMTVAKAIRVLSSLHLIRDISLSENLNRDTLLNGQSFREWEEQWMGEYVEMLDFIVRNMDVSKTDCFECGQEVLMGVGNIYS